MQEETTVIAAALKKFRPEKNIDKSNQSDYFPKDKIFNKKKTFIDSKKPFEEQSIDADWRRITVSRKNLVLIKGQAITKDELTLFDSDSKAYFLEKSTKKSTRKVSE